jgi:hypothetical protein
VIDHLTRRHHSSSIANHNEFTCPSSQEAYREVTGHGLARVDLHNALGEGHARDQCSRLLLQDMEYSW